MRVLGDEEMERWYQELTDLLGQKTETNNEYVPVATETPVVPSEPEEEHKEEEEEIIEGEERFEEVHEEEEVYPEEKIPNKDLSLFERRRRARDRQIQEEISSTAAPKGPEYAFFKVKTDCSRFILHHGFSLLKHIFSSCKEAIHIRGLFDTVNCYTCGALTKIAPETWKSLLSGANTG